MANQMPRCPSNKMSGKVGPGGLGPPGEWLVVPQFVLEELQLVAASADSLERNRSEL